MLDLDTNFPNLSGEQSTDAKLASVQNYLYMLVEQLRYSLRNLDLSNWNSAALEGFTGSITEPIYGRIEDGEGRMNQFELDAEGLRGRISDAEGNITSLQADAEGFRAAISDAQGNITQLQADAEGLKSSVSDAEGRLSVVEQKADSVTTTVGELGGSFTQLQQTVNGFTFKDESGTTKVKGSSVETGSLVLTGSITWSDLNSSVQNSINNAGISEATARSIASTVITSTLVAAPTIMGAEIYGGEFWNADQDYCLYMTENGANGIYDYGNFRLYEATPNNFEPDNQNYQPPYFSLVNSGETSYQPYGRGVGIWTYGHPVLGLFAGTGGHYGYATPWGTWDFAEANIVNFTPKFT